MHYNNDTLCELVMEGLIQCFEYTYEIAWNMMKDYAFHQGNNQIGGSRDATRYAFSINLIQDGDLWMNMIKSIIKTSHQYDKESDDEIYSKIRNEYYSAFTQFQEMMESKRDGGGEQQSLF